MLVRGGKAGARLALHSGKVAGKWIQANEHMSAAAREYQRFITGTDQVFLRNGVKFDGLINNVLVDAKAAYGSLIQKKQVNSMGLFRKKWSKTLTGK